MTTRGGNTTRDPPNPKADAGKDKEQQEITKKTQKDVRPEEEEMARKDPLGYTDTTYLPFPTRNRKQAVDEQFTRFVEMIEKIHESVPLMDVKGSCNVAALAGPFNTGWCYQPGLKGVL